MSRILQIQELILRSRRLPWLVWGAALIVLALAIVLTARPVRSGIREQILRREGEVLHAVAVAQLEALRVGELEEDPADPVTQLTALLNLQNVQGVLGIRLFDRAGRFVTSVPGTLWEQDVPQEVSLHLGQLEPFSRFIAPGPLARQFYPETVSDLETARDTAMVEVYVPLHRPGSARLLGGAEFVMDGSRLAQELARLDRRMVLQGAVIFLAVGFLFGVALVGVSRRFRRMHRELAERTQSLLLANAELSLAARSAALGAITSHLVYGLKSPLAGLQNLVTSGGRDSGVPGAEDWAQAQASMKRMQALIREVLQVLHEHPVEAQYEVEFGELAQSVIQKVEPMAARAGVQLVVRCRSNGCVDNRAANLVRLIPANLVENAIQASPREGTVELEVGPSSGGTVCRVSDRGAGIPANLRKRLFEPVASSKEGGSGLGLAISKQLAQHLGARLDLARSTDQGSVFELELGRTLTGVVPGGGALPLTNRQESEVVAGRD